MEIINSSEKVEQVGWKGWCYMGCTAVCIAQPELAFIGVAGYIYF